MLQSAGVIVVDPSNGSVLCVRAYANWDFPKGLLDANETHEQAALRELTEETCLTLDDVDLCGEQAPPIEYGSGKRKKRATYFLAARTSTRDPVLPISPELGKPENDEYRWVPIAELLDLMPTRLQPVVAYLKDRAG